MKSVKYGLRMKNSDDLLKCKIVEIKGNEEKETVYLLGKEGEQHWLLDDVEEVKKALETQTNWYESSQKRPYITLSKELLEIVEVSEIKRVESYSSRSIYEDLDSYHRQKVEEALKLHTMGKEKKENQVVNEEKAEEPVEEMIEFFAPTTKVETNVKTVEKKKTVKAKVKCIRDIPKEMGSVRMKSDPVSLCFKEDKCYLAYIKQEKLFIMNEDKVPEFVCNAPSDEEWEKNIFFERHFLVEEYID